MMTLTSLVGNEKVMGKGIIKEEDDIGKTQNLNG